METQTRWVRVTVQLSPSPLTVQVASGMPWQVTQIFPTVAVGVNVSGADTFRHWFPVLSQPLTGQVSSP